MGTERVQRVVYLSTGWSPHNMPTLGGEHEKAKCHLSYQLRPDVVIIAGRSQQHFFFFTKVTILKVFDLQYFPLSEGGGLRQGKSIERLGKDFTGSLMHSWPADAARWDNSSSISGFYSLTNEDPPPLLSTTDRRLSSSHPTPLLESPLPRFCNVSSPPRSPQHGHLYSPPLSCRYSACADAYMAQAIYCEQSM